MLCQGDEIVGMPLLHSFRLAALLQPLSRVLVDRFEEQEAWLAVQPLPQLQQAFVQQRFQPFGYGDGKTVATDSLYRLHAAPALEDRQPGKQGLFIRVEQVVTPVDRPAQRA